jgi:hypothetical protein
MSVARLIRWIVILGIAFFVLDWFHITPAGLWRKGSQRLEDFKNDTLSLTTGATANKLVNAAKQEMQAAQAATSGNEMTRELQAERTRIVEAKFNALQNQTLTPTEQDKLAEQLVKSAQQAAGGN